MNDTPAFSRLRVPGIGRCFPDSAFLLAASFVIGIVCCCWICSGTPVKEDFLSCFHSSLQNGPGDFTDTVLFLGLYFFLVFLFGTSRFGFLFIPVLLLVRGFALSACAVCLLVLSELTWRFFLCSLMPSLLSSVAIFILAKECMDSSLSLYCVSNYMPCERTPRILFYPVFVSSVLLIVAAGIRQLMISFFT